MKQMTGRQQENKQRWKGKRKTCTFKKKKDKRKAGVGGTEDIQNGGSEEEMNEASDR